MSDSLKTLLPEGLRDLLPPDAAFEAEVVYRLTESFGANGYELVKPPLAEFQDSLLAGAGTALRDRIFRMTDPASQRTLGFRADMTTQVARIATTRLAAAPRPLRLMYAGQVLRVRGDQLEPERQFTQAGIELIGADSEAADVEVILTAAEALDAIGVREITIDLAFPDLVSAIQLHYGVAATERLSTAIDHKDVAEIKAAGGAAGALLCALVESSGAFAEARKRVAALELPPTAKAKWDSLVAVAEAVAAAAPQLTLTVDAMEMRGLAYHTGVTFSIFAKAAQREIGRGGRYNVNRANGSLEPATGATLFVDTLLRVTPPMGEGRRLWVPPNTSRALIRQWQSEGWTVVADLGGAETGAAAAKRLRCTHYLEGVTAMRIKDDNT